MANIDIEKTLRQSTGRYQPAKAAQAAARPVRIDVGQTMANRRRQLEGLGIRTATERRKPEAAQPHPALERMVNGESGQRVVRYQDYPQAVQRFLDGEHGAAHSRRPGAFGSGFGEGGGFSADTPLKPKSEFAEYDERVNAKTGNPIINTIDAVLDADMVGSSAVTGMAVFNNLVAQTANLIPGVIADATGTENKFLTQKLADFTGRNLDQLSRKTAEDASQHGTAGAVVSNLVSGTASALPNAVLAVLSGGGSTVAQLAPHASGIAEAVSSGVRTMAQNPMYWSSFISTVGSEYEEAAANGADAGPALVAALTSSLLGSAVEVGGGLETLPGELRGADVNRLAAWLKSGLDEGTEEVIQDLISGVAQKALVDSGKPWASMADDGAVVNPGRLAQAFGMGAGVGLILGGGQDLAVNAINQAAAANSPAVQQAAAGTVDGQEYIANIRAKNTNRELVSTETEPSMQTSAVQEQPVQPGKEDGSILLNNVPQSPAGNNPRKGFGANRRITAGPVLQRVQEEAAWRPILEALAEESQEALLRAHYDTALSEDRSPEALRWNELSALYDLYTRDQFTPQDPAPASQTMEEDGGRALREAALPAHVERLAKALGVEVVVEERLQPAVKGYIQGNAIHLPPSSPDAAMEILRHELTHRMQELSPRQYGKYRDYVIRQYTAADAAAKYEAYRRAGHPLTPEQVVDELVAEYAGRHLREEGAIRRLAGENRTLAEWVRETIRALAERIREKLGRSEPTLEHAQRLWDRAFRAAEQHASRQNTSVPLPRPESPARYSIREEIDSSHSEEYTGENAGMGEIGAGRLPQGITEESFKQGSKLIKNRVGDISDDIVVQGSRASGTAKATSDIDIAIRVKPEKFDELIQKSFNSPNPGTAKERTMLHAIETGKIQAGEAGLRGLRKELEQIFGMEVDISIIKEGGAFDNPPFIPINKN